MMLARKVVLFLFKKKTTKIEELKVSKISKNREKLKLVIFMIIINYQN